MTLHHSSGRWQLGLGLSLLTMSLWGFLPIALSISLQSLDAYTVTWFRFLVAFGLLGLHLTKQGKLPDLRKLPVSSWRLWLVATVGLALNYVLFLQGLAYTTPSVSQVLIQFSSLLMGLGALVIFKERYTLSQWSGLSVMVLGFTLFFNDRLRNLISTSSNQYLIGSGLLLLASIAWAIYALAQKQLLQKLPSPAIMWGIYGGSALLFSPFVTPQKLFSLTPLQAGMLLFCALNTLVAYGAFAEALAHWEASRVSAVLSLTPIMTIACATSTAFFFPNLIKPESLTLLSVTGAILVVMGSLAIALGTQKSSSNA